MNGIVAHFQTRISNFALDLSLALPGQGITALFGPSGCGKTTALRCLAGLQSATGHFVIDGESWHTRPAHRRAVGVVFQEASLFAHLDVRGNLEYGYRRTPAPERRIRFDQAVAWLGLSELLERDPAQLSGGERQRVAIARALLT
ncbi:MAG: ATP-binding cassette domain-containing protein, partial [Gammaproteobacteria bacterium]|nr:ATP-binding cassette domain-containing protein [Gammaproteobacteria bacterium]